MARREKKRVTQLKSALENEGAKLIIATASPYSEVGTPDVIGCFQGRFFAIEVKEPGEEPTPIQLYRIEQWRKAGAIAFVTDDVPDAVGKVKRWSKMPCQTCRF